MKQHTLTKGRELAESPPARGRGLKRLGCQKTEIVFPVAPRAGAWIETIP